MITLKNCFKTLFIGGRDGFSMARTAFWIILGCMLYRFMTSNQDISDIPDGFLALLIAILTYTLSGKAVSKFDFKHFMEFKNKDDDKK